MSSYKFINLDASTAVAPSTQAEQARAALYKALGVYESSKSIGFTARPFETNATTERIVEEEDSQPEIGEGVFIKLYTDLEKLSELPRGWDGYDAEPPNEIASFWCRETLKSFEKQNLIPTGITPSVENGLGIYFQEGDKYADIEFLNTGIIVAITSTQDGVPKAWEVETVATSIADAVETICVFIGNRHAGADALRGSER